MKIKINICPSPLCAYFYAWSENEAEEYIYQNNGSRINKVKFLHNPHCQSLLLYNKDIPQGQDDDFSISLTVSIKFNDFCKRLETSEFNLPKKYHILNHNCTHSVMYALKEAGIVLNNIPSYTILNRIDSIGLLRLPLFSITPFDLYYHLKKYKIALVRQSNEISTFNHYKDKLNLWQSASNKTSVSSVVKDIVKEVEKKQYRHEEHTEKYTDLLKKMDETIAYPIKNGFFKDIHQHYKRRTNYHFQKWHFTASFLLGCVATLARYKKKESQKNFLPRNPISFTAEFLLILLLGKMMYEMVRNPFNHRSDISPTLLSKKIEEFNQIIRYP